MRKFLVLLLAGSFVTMPAFGDGDGFRIQNWPTSYWQATQPVSGTFWQATQPISGSVSVSNFPATQPVSGSFWQTTQPVSGTFWQSVQPVSQSGNWTQAISNWPASQAVTGTFWQATQPVSIATMPTTPVTGTFWPPTQPVSGTFWQATQPVSIASMPSTPVTGTFWQATQPVSIASMPTTAVTGNFFQATQPVSVASMPTTPVTGAFFQATQPVSIAAMPSTPVTGTFFQALQPVTEQSEVPVSSTSASGVSTSTGALAVANQFAYINSIEISMYATAARTANATPIVCTTSNFPSALAFTFDTLQSSGTVIERIYQPPHPIKSNVVNTITSITCPATTSVIWRINMLYYSGT